ncbi:MAG: hypothetical protein IJO63_02260 [Bacilli bacterium]|nr:hypothetical protein [Bacilli bacterium]
MEAIIEVDIKHKDDIYERYNQSRVSRDLINYIIEQAAPIINSHKITILINNLTGEEIECKKLLVAGLNREFDKNLVKHYRNNMAQVYYLFMGLVTLFAATLLRDGVFKELIVIGGWVFIWALIEMEIFGEMEGRKRRRIIKKLLNCTITEKK